MDAAHWSGREVQHISPRGTRYWKATLVGKEVHTLAREGTGKPKETSKDYPTKEKASIELLRALRKKMLEDFVYRKPLEEANAGELVFAMALPGGGPADNFDVSVDGRVLFVGAGRGDPSAQVLRAEPSTGKVERFPVEADPRHPQLFIHAALLDASGEVGYFGLNDHVRSVELTTGAFQSIASVLVKGSENVNPFCVEPQRDAAHQKLLLDNGPNLEVRELSSGKILCRIPVGTSTAECRKIALSPSGRLVVAYLVSRYLVYNHQDAIRDKTNELQVWRVEDGKLISRIALNGKEDEPRELGVTPDDREVLYWGHEHQITRVDIASHKRSAIHVPHQYGIFWDFTPKGRLVVSAGNEVLFFAPLSFERAGGFVAETTLVERVVCANEELLVIGGDGLFCVYKMP